MTPGRSRRVFARQMSTTEAARRGPNCLTGGAARRRQGFSRPRWRCSAWCSPSEAPRRDHAHRAREPVLGLRLRLLLVSCSRALLSMMLFLFSVVLGSQPDGFSKLDFALFVACGSSVPRPRRDGFHWHRVPEAEMHLVKNVFLPIELIPVRTVAMSLVTRR